MKYIRGAFNFAFEKGYINKNPTPTMKLKVGDKIKKVLTLVHVKTLLTQAKIMNSEWYPIWATAPYTGMRNGELYALTWDKVSFENRKIVIDSSWNNKDGFKGTKSGDDRIAEIVPELLILLMERKLSEIDSKFVLPRIDHWDRGEQARDLRMFLQVRTAYGEISRSTCNLVHTDASKWCYANKSYEDGQLEKHIDDGNLYS